LTSQPGSLGTRGGHLTTSREGHQTLDHVVEWKGLLKATRMDNGPEFISEKNEPVGRKNQVGLNSSSLEN